MIRCCPLGHSSKATHQTNPTNIPIFLGMLASILLALCPALTAWAGEPEGLFVTQIALDPHQPKTLYALTTYSIGVLKSTDGGANWSQINQGIRSYSLYQLTVHPKEPKKLYLGAGGAGLYKSTDGGVTWTEMNEGLQNTDIGTLVLHPTDPETVYVVTSTGLFKSPDGGKSWVALNQGDDFTSSQQFQSLLVLPTPSPTFYLASGNGLYTRTEADAGWVSFGESFARKQVSAMAQDPRTGRLYAAVFRRGTLETLREGGLFTSEDGGRHWSRLWAGLEGDWIRVILIDPVNPKLLYLGTSGRGILKSTDGGKSFKESNVGLNDPDRDIRTLVMDPRNQMLLYAGSHGHWIFRSRDAGATWEPLPLGPHQTVEQIIAGLNQEDKLIRKASKITPPTEFKKCNQCHGWTDISINSYTGSWRVAANRRDWTLSVKRMSHAAGLTPEEEVQITEFLNSYTHSKQPRGS